MDIVQIVVHPCNLPFFHVHSAITFRSCGVFAEYLIVTAFPRAGKAAASPDVVLDRD